MSAAEVRHDAETLARAGRLILERWPERGERMTDRDREDLELLAAAYKEQP